MIKIQDVNNSQRFQEKIENIYNNKNDYYYYDAEKNQWYILTKYSKTGTRKKIIKELYETKAENK